MHVTKTQASLTNQRGQRTWCYKKKTNADLLNITTVEVAAAGNIYQKYAQLQTVKDNATEKKPEIPPVYAALLDEFPRIHIPDFDKTPQVIHHIETKGRPVRATSRPIGAPGTPRYEKGKQAWQNLEKLKVIKRLEPEENSYWTSALHLQLKADGSLRPCGDYRPLNAVTELDGYPLPNIKTFAAKLRGSKIFAKVDLTKAYYNVGLQPDLYI